MGNIHALVNILFKKGGFTIFFLFYGLLVVAQSDLSGGQRHSTYTYIYRVSEREALAIFHSEGADRADRRNTLEKYLHKLVDSFSEDPPLLAPGDYLWVSAAGSKLSVELRTIGDLQYDLINNDRDLVFSLHTKEGRTVADARVFINSRPVPYDDATTTYRISRRKKGGIIKVSYQGALYFFPVSRRSPLRSYRTTFRYRVRHAAPLKFLSPLLDHWFPDRSAYHTRFSYQTANEQRYPSYMVFSKPKYKPGDSVLGKAFVSNKRGRPVNRPLWVRISNRNLDTDTLIELIRPYRAGGYSFYFVLTDSLHLSLDDEYLVTLEEFKSRKYKTADYDGDLDEDEYAARRKVMARGHFKYEDYSLQSIRFAARADKKENSPGDPAALYFKATDENELPLPDASVEVYVQASRKANRFLADNVFIKDTLWTWRQSLDPVGETKIVVPDSVFPAADLDYTIHCRLLNSSKETRSETFYETYKGEVAKIFFLPREDSLGIDYRIRNSSHPMPSMLYAFNEKDDTIESRPLMLPGVIRINPYSSRYEIAAAPNRLPATGKVQGQYPVSDQKPRLSCIASRTRDSVSIGVINPLHLKFWYTLFAGEKIIARGYSNQLSYADRTTTCKNYFISLQYIWAGKVGKEDYTVPYRDKLLQITIQAPAFIYPGQTTTVEIGVKNAEGRPVSNADLTAWSFTSKFKEAPTPNIPYLGKWYRGRKRHPDFYADKAPDLSTTTLLNWKRWSREMGLDTLEYYKFLHPDGVYINTEPAKDQVTQIAPFVSRKGELVPVHQFYVDEVPVFFSQAQQLARYSFYVEPGRHSLQLRTSNYLIRLDSIRVVKGKKTFICIDADTSNKAVHIQKMPDSLTNQEKARWSRYMILVENNFGEKFARISQDHRVFLLNGHPDAAAYYNHAFLVGPQIGQESLLKVAGNDGWQQSFEPEGNQRFLITKGLIKEKQVPGPTPYPFSAYLEPQMPRIDFHDWVLTEREVDSLWQDYLDDRSARWDLLRNATQSSYHNGTLQVGVEYKKNEPELYIKNLFLFRYDNPDFMQAYKGTDRNLGVLQPGNYRLLVLLKGDSYLLRDSIKIREGGLNYYEISSSVRHERDVVSVRIAGIVNSLTKEWKAFNNGPELDGVRESFNDQYLDPATFPRMVMGRVTDMDGHPLMAASITLKGTHVSTQTDVQGYFRLHTPERGTLAISYIGYNSVERFIGDTSSYEIKLQASTMDLNEVVVVGYGTTTQRMSTGSISTISSFGNVLMGKAAGVQIQVRGSSSVGSPAPLVIVDGLPYSGDYRELDPATIASVRILKDQDATALYGQNAAGGIILITTKKNAAHSDSAAGTPAAGNRLRRHFRDDAFWQPMLSTDEKGMAHFLVNYPDDITSWKTRVAAVKGRYTGFAEGLVKSFKALSANLAVPSFLVEGDSANLIGKMLNYTPDTLLVQRSWLVNDRVLMNSAVALRNSLVETMPVKAESLPDPAKRLSDSLPATVGLGDSLKVTYSLQKKDGYFDGEERMIPIYQRGVKETQGVFAPLEGDTSFTLSFDPALGSVQLYAESSLVPVLLEEIERIGDYEYLCNEQLASKLRALLEKKKIFLFLGRAFKEDKNVQALISRLMLARGSGGLWGWWNHNEPALWISLHVSEALLEAEKAGYPTQLNRSLLKDYLVYTIESGTRIDQIHAIRLLQELGARVDYKRYIDSVETLMRRREKASPPNPVSLYEKLKLLEVKQEAGLEVLLDTLISKHQLTVRGNWFWGEENRALFDNAFQNTLLMYRLLRKSKEHPDILRKVRNYFLEKRAGGCWRNTYESSLALETLLPDWLGVDGGDPTAGTARMGNGIDVIGPADKRAAVAGLTDTLTIGSGAPVTGFPYKTVLPAAGSIVFNKKGRLPVYFTVFQQFWNKKPAKVSGMFEVSSSFEKEGQPLSVPRLKGGDPVVLKTLVSVKADADYVMVEIPIPAGCSYLEKEQPGYNNEVHREYFKSKVSIFCRALPKGEYTFSVVLLPRFTGLYEPNPARAEMMYFPVFYGREAMKEVTIY